MNFLFALICHLSMDFLLPFYWHPNASLICLPEHFIKMHSMALKNIKNSMQLGAIKLELVAENSRYKCLNLSIDAPARITHKINPCDLSGESETRIFSIRNAN